MAIQSLTDLKALINSTIQDNTTNDISGSDVQTALINAIDTLDSLEGFINVHKANGQTTITAYGSKALARAAVPDDCKKEGVVIAYKISTGWLIEQNLDATAGTWGDDASWQTIGPVSVSQNTSEGGINIEIANKQFLALNQNGKYVDYPYIIAVEQSIKEIYLDNYAEGLKISAIIWNGSKLTLLIVDSNNNIVVFLNEVLLTSNEVLKFKSVNNASIQLNGYIVMTDTNVATSSVNITLQPDCFDMRKSKTILSYLITENPDIFPMDTAPTQNSNKPVTSGGIYNTLHPQFTNRAELNPIFEELYINGYKEGYYMSYCIWTGSKVIIIIRDSSDNIILFANELDATAGEVFSFSQGGVTLYAIFTSSTYGISPQNTNFAPAALNIRYNPQIFDWIVNSKSDMEYPLNVSRFDQGGVLPAGHKASWITISRRMDDEFDSVFNFANKTYPNLTNKWFDFYAVGKHTRGIDGVSKCNTYIDWTGLNGLSTSDALMMAVIVGAVNNIDGDNTSAKWHTGGAHAYGDSATGATPTMRELSNTVLADGKIVPVGRLNVKCKKLTIDVVNNIQGYNTCKEDGTGREILQQKYHIDCTNDYIDVYCELMALEDVIIYGSNVVTGMGLTNMQYRFIGSQSKKGLYSYNGSNVPDNNDNKINAFRIINDGYSFDIDYDLNYGLGNKLMESAPNCFVTSVAKAYFANIASDGQIALSANESISWKVRLKIRKA